MGDYDPTMQKVQTAVMGGNPPDVYCEISELPTLAMNACDPLDVSTEEYLSEFFPAFLENSYGQDGKLYCVPSSEVPRYFTGTRSIFEKPVLSPTYHPELGKR